MLKTRAERKVWLAKAPNWWGGSAELCRPGTVPSDPMTAKGRGPAGGLGR